MIPFTYRLIDAAVHITGLSSDDLLQQLGEYWIQYSAREGFGELLRLGGHNVREFLTNLDSMHARLALTFPELRPPSFRVEMESTQCIRLRYRSDRQGLTLFALGLLVGLGKHFDERVDVRN